MASMVAPAASLLVSSWALPDRFAQVSAWVPPWTTQSGQRCWRSSAGFEQCCAAAGVASCSEAPELASQCCDFPGEVALESPSSIPSRGLCGRTELLRQDIYDQDKEGPAWIQQRNALVISLLDAQQRAPRGLGFNFSDLDTMLFRYRAMHLGVLLDMASEQILSSALQECRIGALSLRLAGHHGQSRVPEVADEVISDPWSDLLQSGWPIFLLLALRLRPKGHKRTVEGYFPGADMIHDAVATIKELVSVSAGRLGLGGEDGSAWGMAKKVLMTLQNKILAQSEVKEMAMRNSRLWHALHLLQEAFVLRVTCPEASLAFPTLIDGHSFRMCARLSDEKSVGTFVGYSPIDDAVVREGHWRDCAAPARLLPVGHNPDHSCIAVDVGANIGVCTLILAQLGHPVIALEPDASNFELLHASLSLPQADGMPLSSKVRLVQVAADTKEGMATMARPRYNAGNSYITGSRDDDNWFAGWVKDMYYSTVPTSRLDDLVAAIANQLGNSLADVCLIKVDVEGAEQRVFSGAPELLKMVQTVVFELNPRRTGAMDCFYILNKVSRSGLTVFGLIPPAEQREIKPSEFGDFINMLLTHPEGETTMAAMRI